ncbi:MAG: hypothetical protein HY981_01815 [Candidatus Magasanikbacteria bacterium]|nr:hypothetical protein [Candidatus Magasanikbacteria bacterium]
MRISLQKRIRRQTQHMKSKAFFPLFGEDLRLVSVCPLCKAKKEAIKTQVVDENEEAHLLHMQCGECGSAVVAVVVHASSGLNSVGMLTDLTYDDVLKFRAAAPIEIDNILAFYEALKNQEKFLEHIA